MKIMLNKMMQANLDSALQAIEVTNEELETIEDKRDMISKKMESAMIEPEFYKWGLDSNQG